jgi:hypothetical protein
MGMASFLPWFTAAGESVSAWDVALYYVVTGNGDGRTGIRAGLPLVLAAGVAAVLVLARQPIRLPVAIGIAAVGSYTAVFAVSRVLRPDPHPDLGVGVLVALAGAAIIAMDAYRLVLQKQASL